MSIKYLFVISVYCLLPAISWAATQNAESCSYADVNAAYIAASAGDTISVPSGDCTWDSTLTVSKADLTIQGAGKAATYLRLGTVTRLFNIDEDADRIRITGFYFDGNNKEQGMIKISTSDPCGGAEKVEDFRIDNNTFNCEDVGYETGGSILDAEGWVYGVFDNNEVVNCRNEVLDICGTGLDAHNRITDYGEYSDGVLYVEDNTFEISERSENIIDGNDGAAWVVRHNTMTVKNGGWWQKMIEAHGTWTACSCPNSDITGVTQQEIYNNDLYIESGGIVSYFIKTRGGRIAVYNNTVHTNGLDIGFVNIDNYRSWDYAGGAYRLNDQGYSDWCHDASAAYTVEGRTFNKTTLAEDLDAVETSIDISSVADFPTYGGAILIGSEQIDYTGINGTTLTGCTRGANQTSVSTHSTSDDVDLFIFGSCLGQTNASYVWGNTDTGVAKNNVIVNLGSRNLPNHNTYTQYDIQSYTQRPGNWQYRNDGTEYSYTPYPYPHPLTLDVQSLLTPKNFLGTPLD